jgi:anti-sigma factor RsiW
MSCKGWNDNWVAHLYDELSTGEEQALQAHLADCASCRAQMAQLSESRQMLRDASPIVPATPPVMILRPRRLFQPLWAYAAGAASALLLFAAGLVAGYQLPLGHSAAQPVATTTQSPSSAGLPAASGQGVTQEQLDLILQRLELLERDNQGRPSDGGRPEPAIEQAFLTRNQFEEELQRWERRSDLERARDFEFLLDEITAAEMRTGAYLDETRQALHIVAVQNDPRFRER